jgi:hypothetical protein
MNDALREKVDAIVRQFAQRLDIEVAPEWILPPASCELLGELGGILPPGSSAFEFGSGRSTHVLRRIFRGVTSVEDSLDWLNATENLSDAVPQRADDKTDVVPLTRCWNRLRPIQSFNVESHSDLLARLRAARLVLVDSPPNPAKREHALFMALRYTPTDAVIVIDDLEVRATARFSERLARQNRRRFAFWRLNIDHQLGVFLKLQATHNIRSVPTPREFVGTWLRA